MKRIIAHSGAFHADDVMAVAALTLVLDKRGEAYEIVRTRDPKVFPTGDFVVDVGEIYDPATNRFDHHQEGGAGKRNDGVPYSSIGLVWKHYGEELCGDSRVADAIDRTMVKALDLGDNGIETYQVTAQGIHPYLWHNVVAAFRPVGGDIGKEDERFLELVQFCRTLLGYLIGSETNRLAATEKVLDIYHNSKDKRILVLPELLQWQDAVATLSDVLFVIAPERTSPDWKLNTTRDDTMGFKNRKDLPRAWAGKFAQELAEISGVPDATFCHNKSFVAGARSREGAIALAQKALES